MKQIFVLSRKNFLKKGPDAKENQKPKENVGPVTLDKILRSIGLEPKKISGQTSRVNNAIRQ